MPSLEIGNPFKSEAAMFRVLVVVMVAMAPVIAVALIVSPLAGALLLGIEVAFFGGLALRRLSHSLTQDVPEPQREPAAPSDAP